MIFWGASYYIILFFSLFSSFCLLEEIKVCHTVKQSNTIYFPRAFYNTNPHLSYSYLSEKTASSLRLWIPCHDIGEDRADKLKDGGGFFSLWWCTWVTCLEIFKSHFCIAFKKVFCHIVWLWIALKLKALYLHTKSLEHSFIYCWSIDYTSKEL